MENLELYNKVRAVPSEAQKIIGGGRLKGMTDINPMWRIKTLTEQFGIVGFGWFYTIEKQWIEQSATGEHAAFCNINLFIKIDGEWSAPINGTGGSMFITNESKGKYTDDECFKKALTDAISVACKAIGIGADVYWNKDKTKYDAAPSKPVDNIDDDLALALDDIKRATTIDQLQQVWSTYKIFQTNPIFIARKDARKKEL